MHSTVDCESPCSSDRRVKRMGLAGVADAGRSPAAAAIAAAQRPTRTSLPSDPVTLMASKAGTFETSQKSRWLSPRRRSSCPGYRLSSRRAFQRPPRDDSSFARFGKSPFCKEFAECGGCDRLGEEVPLVVFTAVATKEFELRTLLHTFCHDVEAQLTGHGNRGPGDGRVAGRTGHPRYERPIDLDGVDWKMFDVRDRRVARPEIIERQADAELLELLKLAKDFRIAVEHAALADLKLQKARFDSGFRERVANGLDEIGSNQLTKRDVHAHPNRREPLIDPGAQLTAGLAKHPVADLNHQSRLFGDRNERRWGDTSQFGRIQPQQRLSRSHASLTSINQWLIVQMHFAPSERRQETAMDRQRSGVVLIIRFVVKPHRTAGHLRLVQGQVGT